MLAKLFCFLGGGGGEGTQATIPRETETGQQKKTFKLIYWGGDILISFTWTSRIVDSACLGADSVKIE